VGLSEVVVRAAVGDPVGDRRELAAAEVERVRRRTGLRPPVHREVALAARPK